MSEHNAENEHITNAAEIGMVAWLAGQIENEEYLLSRGGGSRETLAFLRREHVAAVVRNPPEQPTQPTATRAATTSEGARHE